MSRKTKDHTAGHQATPNTSKSTCNFTGIATCIKALIVTLTLWGWLPVALADWLIHLGELRHE